MRLVADDGAAAHHLASPVVALPGMAARFAAGSMGGGGAGAALAAVSSGAHAAGLRAAPRHAPFPGLRGGGEAIGSAADARGRGGTASGSVPQELTHGRFDRVGPHEVFADEHRVDAGFL